MTKLPINLLLYVAILGLAGGSGYQFYLAVTEKNQVDQTQDKSRFDESVKRGQAGAEETRAGPDWRREGFWEHFRQANFTGKEPPPPDQPVETEPEAPEVPLAQTPLEEIFALMCVVYNGSASRVVIRYKPEANVEPPEEIQQALAGGVQDVVGASPQKRRGAPVPPSFGSQEQGHIHDLALEDTLWKPFSHIRLVRVNEDASHAFFVREDPAVAKDEWTEEKIFPELLGLPENVRAALHAGGIDVARTAVDEQPVSQAESSGWVPMDDTKDLGGNRFNIGRRDRDLIARDPGRIFNQDVGTASWQSRTGRRSGVKITSIAPGYDRYGVAVGDIVLSINGEAVRNKADAIRVGKRQYKRGVRTFDVEFLSRGRRVVRSYVAPDK